MVQQELTQHCKATTPQKKKKKKKNKWQLTERGYIERLENQTLQIKRQNNLCPI